MFAMSREKAFKAINVACRYVGTAGLVGSMGLMVTNPVAEAFDIHNVVTEFAQTALKTGWLARSFIISGGILSGGFALHLNELCQRPLKSAGLGPLPIEARQG